MNLAAVLACQVTSVFLVARCTTLGKELQITTLVLMRIVARGAGHAFTFLEATALHQSQQLIGSVRIVVLRISGLHVQCQELVERFARAIGECGLQEFANTGMALSAHLVCAVL